MGNWGVFITANELAHRRPRAALCRALAREREALSCLVRKRTLEGLRDSRVHSLADQFLSSKNFLPPQHVTQSSLQASPA